MGVPAGRAPGVVCLRSSFLHAPRRAAGAPTRAEAARAPERTAAAPPEAATGNSQRKSTRALSLVALGGSAAAAGIPVAVMPGGAAGRAALQVVNPLHDSMFPLGGGGGRGDGAEGPPGNGRDLRVTRVLTAFLASHLCTLAFVAWPVVVSLPTTWLPYRMFGFNDSACARAWHGAQLPPAAAAAAGERGRARGVGSWVAAAVVRFLEPFIAANLNLWALLESNVLLNLALPVAQRTSPPYGVLAAFIFSLSLYHCGAVMHTAAVMFKHPVSDFMAVNSAACAPDGAAAITALHYWLRTVWEHNVGHYMYAVGGILVSFVLQVCARMSIFISVCRRTHTLACPRASSQYAYRDVALEKGLVGARDRCVRVRARSPRGARHHALRRCFLWGARARCAPSDGVRVPACARSARPRWRGRCLWVANIFAYAFLVAAVAIDFPSGCIVILCFLPLYGGGVLGSFAWRRWGRGGSLLSWGRHLVVQMYLWAYAVALFIVIVWVAKCVRACVRARAHANVSLHCRVVCACSCGSVYASDRGRAGMVSRIVQRR